MCLRRGRTFLPASKRDRNRNPGPNEEAQWGGSEGSSSPKEQQRQQTGGGNRQQGGEPDRDRSNQGQQGGQGQQQQQGGQRQQGGSNKSGSNTGRDSERDREVQIGQAGRATGRERDQKDR
jgi:transcription termination factor Rho